MEQLGIHRQRRRRRHLDTTQRRISDLPDDVLRRILLRMGSVPAAARTCVLSRQWRGVWADLPELVFHDYGQLRNHRSFLNSVDGALAHYSAAGTLRLLYISMFYMGSRVPAAIVSRWLRFASERVAGDLLLCLPWHPEGGEEEEELELPLCVRARSIQLSIGYGFRQLRLPRAGTFAALTSMMLRDATIDVRELQTVVCWQCACLVELQLRAISLVAVSDMAIRCLLLKRLYFEVKNTSRLVVDTPSIEVLILSNLTKVSVAALPESFVPHRGDNDPHRQLLGRHLRRLVVKGSPQVMPVLMRHFVTVDQLELDLTVLSGGDGYKTFLRATNKLAKGDVLVIQLSTEWHAYEPGLLYLLRKSSGMRKLVVHLPWTSSSLCMPGCTCGRKGSEKTNNIKLDSLEVVEINDFTGEDHHVNILKLLLSCKKISASRIVINISYFRCSVREGICQGIRDGAQSTDIKFNVWLHGRWMPYP